MTTTAAAALVASAGITVQDLTGLSRRPDLTSSEVTPRNPRRAASSTARQRHARRARRAAASLDAGRWQIESATPASRAGDLLADLERAGAYLPI
jgi:hypothetical protein